MKHILNRLIDEAVHPRGRAKTLDQILVDEVLHACVEGGFKPEKFVRYTVLPLLKEKPKRRKGRRGRRV